MKLATRPSGVKSRKQQTSHWRRRPPRIAACLIDSQSHFRRSPERSLMTLMSSMKSTLTKKRCVALATALTAGLALRGAHAQSTPARAMTTHKLAEEQFKNIKVLNGIPAEQVIPAMQFITASLGVECEYCHVRQEKGLAFDKDDKKPKVAARKMIQMVSAINKDNFEGKREVTCFSCHRGAADPVGTPIVATEDAAPESAAENKAAAPA